METNMIAQSQAQAYVIHGVPCGVYMHMRAGV